MEWTEIAGQNWVEKPLFFIVNISTVLSQKPFYYEFKYAQLSDSLKLIWKWLQQNNNIIILYRRKALSSKLFVCCPHYDEANNF
jgi:hypothetical protein